MVTWQEFQNIAKRVSDETGFPISVILGQAAVETGRDPNKAPQNNWFGIKGSGTSGTQNLKTQEAGKKGFYNTTANFASYIKAEDSVRAYVNLIQTKYPKAWANRNDPIKMVQAIKEGGYATNPDYVALVTGTPEFRNNLNNQPSQTTTPTTNESNGLWNKLLNLGVKQAQAANIGASPNTGSSATLKTPTPRQTSLPSNTNQNYSTYKAPPENASWGPSSPYYSPPKSFTVKKGDTLWEIAQLLLGSGNKWRELQGYSGDPRKLPIGTEISTKPPKQTTTPTQVNQSKVPVNLNSFTPLATAVMPKPTFNSATPGKTPMPRVTNPAPYQNTYS